MHAWTVSGLAWGPTQTAQGFTTETCPAKNVIVINPKMTGKNQKSLFPTKITRSDKLRPTAHPPPARHRPWLGDPSPLRGDVVPGRPSGNHTSGECPAQNKASVAQRPNSSRKKSTIGTRSHHGVVKTASANVKS